MGPAMRNESVAPHVPQSYPLEEIMADHTPTPAKQDAPERISDLPDQVSVDATQAEPVKGGLNFEKYKTDSLLAPRKAETHKDEIDIYS